MTDAHALQEPDRLARDEQTIEDLYGQIFDLKASLGTLVALMQDDIEAGKVRGTMVRVALLKDARRLSRA